jgi:hypothetical protein
MGERDPVQESSDGSLDPGLVAPVVPGVDQFMVFFAVVIVYDVAVGYLLFRKLSDYTSAFEQLRGLDATEETTTADP